MRRGWAALVGLLLATAATAAPDKADRQAFYDLVDRYQMFVVPHCEPDIINAYRMQNAARDAAFAQSLKGTKLADVYARAVSDREKHDRKTVYDCQPTASPRPTPGGRTVAQRRRAEREAARLLAAEAKRDRNEHFTEGDRIFAEMVALRDRTAAAARN
ncbi:hypothetical protein [Sphingomonas sp. 8AM]|uniref:hypothetical protein n=1 Tax=Sphingomonas sp. 8AM TaxID=2653170 RepID=UPI0012F1DFB5|nr:hypothetical protein [Sphingomonas sp. 8AM]VXC59027.1 conserved exported hypothetical protein [Sphingomonas sp. 8AM]